MVNSISDNQSSSSGRSPDADQIYQKYLEYYGDINDVINKINQIPSSSISSSERAGCISQFVSLQKQLYSVYQNQYNSSAATLETFENACNSLGDQATQIYDEVINTYISPSSSSETSSSSPMNIFTNEATNSSSSSTDFAGSSSKSSETTGSASSSTSGTTESTTSTGNTGRSPEADLIYNQYLSYYNDINTKINYINQLSCSTLNQSGLVNTKSELVALQQQLYPIYVSQYGNSSATLSTFQEACEDIEAQVVQLYNSTIGTSQDETTNGAFNTGSSSETDDTTGTGSTTSPTDSTITTGTTGSSTDPVSTTGTTGVSPVTQQSHLAGVVENSTWYIDWTTRDTPIPRGVNSVNIFVGNMYLDAAGNPAIGGFGTLSQNPDQMAFFIQACHSEGIDVKASLGGGGGSYDNTWDVLTNDNVQAFAQALANFCESYQLDGVDFDCEEFTSADDNPAQQVLVGTLIKEFKLINPEYQTSFDTNAGFGTYFPWQGILKNILDASLYTDPTTGGTACGIDRLYIMAYFNSMSDEQNWITGWADWMEANYNFTPAQITVGMFPAYGSYDANAFSAWAASQGYSTSFWNYDPSNPTQSNATGNGILDSYNSAG